MVLKKIGVAVIIAMIPTLELCLPLIAYQDLKTRLQVRPIHLIWLLAIIPSVDAIAHGDGSIQD